MIVVNTSAMVEYLVGSGPTREAVRATITSETVVVPHEVDLECANAIRRVVRTGDRDPSDAAFVALAEAFSAPLVTVDSRLEGVPGLCCDVRNLRV